MKVRLLLLLCLPLLLGCKPTQKAKDITQEKEFAEYYDICLEWQFHVDYGQQEIITMETKRHDIYFLSNIYYRYEFENDIYLAKYIGALNINNELIIRKVNDGQNIIGN